METKTDKISWSWPLPPEEQEYRGEDLPAFPIFGRWGVSTEKESSRKTGQKLDLNVFHIYGIISTCEGLKTFFQNLKTSLHMEAMKYIQDPYFRESTGGSNVIGTRPFDFNIYRSFTVLKYQDMYKGELQAKSEEMLGVFTPILIPACNRAQDRLIPTYLPFKSSSLASSTSVPMTSGFQYNKETLTSIRNRTELGRHYVQNPWLFKVGMDNECTKQHNKKDGYYTLENELLSVLSSHIGNLWAYDFLIEIIDEYCTTLRKFLKSDGIRPPEPEDRAVTSANCLVQIPIEGNGYPILSANRTKGDVKRDLLENPIKANLFAHSAGLLSMLSGWSRTLANLNNRDVNTFNFQNECSYKLMRKTYQVYRLVSQEVSEARPHYESPSYPYDYRGMDIKKALHPTYAMDSYAAHDHPAIAWERIQRDEDVRILRNITRDRNLHHSRDLVTKHRPLSEGAYLPYRLQSPFPEDSAFKPVPGPNIADYIYHNAYYYFNHCMAFYTPMEKSEWEKGFNMCFNNSNQIRGVYKQAIKRATQLADDKVLENQKKKPDKTLLAKTMSPSTFRGAGTIKWGIVLSQFNTGISYAFIDAMRMSLAGQIEMDRANQYDNITYIGEETRLLNGKNLSNISPTSVMQDVMRYYLYHHFGTLHKATRTFRRNLLRDIMPVTFMDCSPDFKESLLNGEPGVDTDDVTIIDNRKQE